MVMSYAGADGLVIRSLLRDDGRQGLVVAGNWTRDVSGSMFDAIQKARERGIPVVISTRVPTGRVFRSAPGKAQHWPKENGCVLADDLSSKARILLMLALTKTRESRSLAEVFDN